MLYYFDPVFFWYMFIPAMLISLVVLLVLQTANLGELSVGRVLKMPKNSAGATNYTPIAPALPAKQVISSFTANASTVMVGNVVTLRWSF
jgi:hypothetical protein